MLPQRHKLRASSAPRNRAEKALVGEGDIGSKAEANRIWDHSSPSRTAPNSHPRGNSTPDHWPHMPQFPGPCDNRNSSRRLPTAPNGFRQLGDGLLPSQSPEPSSGIFSFFTKERTNDRWKRTRGLTREIKRREGMDQSTEGSSGYALCIGRPASLS